MNTQMHHTKKKRNFCSQSGNVDAGLLFVAGLFFLTIALVVVYVSRFGLAPLPESKKISQKNLPGAAVLSLSEPTTPVSNEVPLTDEEIQNQTFLDSLPNTPVREVFIGSYGTIDKNILEGLQSTIAETLGVKTTVLAPGAAVPKEEPFFDKTRKQYNSDLLLKSVKQSSEVYGREVRFVYVVDLDMVSFSEPSQTETLWPRTENGANVVLISLNALRKKTGGLSTETVQETLLDRAQKIALRGLGATVGFDASPSAKNPSCLMYPAITREELDAEQITLCSPESLAVAKIFQK